MPDLRAVPPAPLTVAAGQARCTPLDVDANVAAAADLVRRAAEAGAEVLVLPELFLTGYELDTIAAAPERYAIGEDDSRLEPLAAACRETGTAAVVGTATRDAASGALHISELVLDRDGRCIGRYDKQHLDAAERAAGFAPGAGGCTLALDGWRLGLGICWDSSFPEHARAAALDGCHAYLVGAMFNRERGERKRTTLGAARALDNAFYVVFANHAGPSGPYEGFGGSAVWGPDGSLVTAAGRAGPAVAVARLDPSALASARAEDFVLVDPSLTAPAAPRSELTPLPQEPPALRSR